MDASSACWNCSIALYLPEISVSICVTKMDGMRRSITLALAFLQVVQALRVMDAGAFLFFCSPGALGPLPLPLAYVSSG